MVKIRGIRTNPNEIESEIMASGLAAAVAVVIVSPTDTAAGPHRDIDGDTAPEGEPLTLVAVQAHHADLRLADLEAFCRSELPPHLRPHRITPIETMPTTPHGKVDRQLVRRLLTDLPRSTSALLTVTQRSITFSALNDPSGTPAWKTVPSWALISRDDHAIPVQAQRFMTARAKSRTVEVPASHAALITNPGTVTHLIETADRATN